MRISEYIEKLLLIKAEHGDLEVDRYIAGSWIRENAKAPEVKYRRGYKPRMRNAAFFCSIDPPELKGEKVVRV